MRTAIFAILCGFLPSFAGAQQSIDDIRALAYAGDVTALEQAFGQAHQQSLSGEITYDHLRDLTEALTTTHPTFLETTTDWLASYPDSPYANALRAFQYRQLGWNVRGGGVARGIPRHALSVFAGYQSAAADHALAAYTAAPDYVPASDAVFRLQPATKLLSRRELSEAISTVMELTPNLGSLERAAGFAEPGWGGNGLADVSALCDLYADKLGDPTYDREICIVHLSYASGWRSGEMPLIWAGVGRRTHPAISRAWAFRVTTGGYEGRTPEDFAAIEDYLTGPGQSDHKAARRYFQSFDASTAERQAIIQDVLEASVAKARADIVHDPFDPWLIEILLGVPGIFNVIMHDLSADRGSHNEFILRLRMAVARPYHQNSWLAVAQTFRKTNEEILSRRALPYYQNMIYYSDHDISAVDRVLLYVVDLVALDHAERYPNDTQVKVTAETPVAITCELVRLHTIVTHQCNGLGLGLDACPEVKQIRPLYDQLVFEALATGQCDAEASASFEALKYTPVELSYDDVMQPLVWE